MHQSSHSSHLISDKDTEWRNQDIEVFYSVWSQTIRASNALEFPVKHSKKSNDQMVKFATFIAPPTVDSLRDRFSRSVIFLVDYSGG